ncbi:MAG: glycosyltransferase family 4 protein [Bauldia sp.]|nr:glycosyltransferase family 4 protein [Bauldia sp.]
MPKARKIRVVIVAGGGRRFEGGVSRAMGYLIDTWQQQDDAPEVRVLDPRGTGSVLWSPFYLARALTQIVWIFSTGRADILHINVSSNASSARKAIVAFTASLMRVPYVIHIHSGIYDRYFGKLRGRYRAFTRRMLTHARRVIVLGNHWQHFLHDEVGVESDRIAVMYNAVPGPDRIDRANDPDTACRILFLGRLVPGKGVPELVAALGDAGVASLPWVATIAGGGDIAAYRTQSAELGIAERVIFPGWVGPTAVHELLLSHDVLVLPSHHEGLPMSVLEGMAYALAIVTTPVGAIPEVIDDEATGILVPPRDVDALSAAIARVVADRGLRERLSRAARDEYLKRFEIRAYASRMLRLYEDVLADRPTRDENPVRRTRDNAADPVKVD